MRKATFATLALSALASFALPMFTPHAHASMIIVDVAGSGDFVSLREGIEAASEGDVVLVMPGTYGGPDNSDLSFGGKDIVLCSAAGPDYTFIDHFSGFSVVFYIHEGESRAAVIDGFTVADATAYDIGPAFCVAGASPTIQNCRFANNYAWGSHHAEGWCGAGFFRESQGALINCVIENNHANCGIGGVGVKNSAVDIEGCVFRGNYDGWEGLGALYIEDTWGMTVRNCLFVGNRGNTSCLHSAGSSYRLTVENCTFVDNLPHYEAAIEHAKLIGSTSSFTMFVRNCIFAFNDVAGVFGAPSEITLAHACVFGNSYGDTLAGDFDPDQVLLEDPRFCNLEGGDYRLCSNSPCLPYIGPWNELVGAYPTGCGGCDSPVERTSWGRIKAMYR